MASTLAAVFNVLVGLVFPIGVLIYLLIKKRSYAIPFLAGVLTFMVSQLLIRLPLLRILGADAGFVGFSRANPVLYSLLLGLSAGVFEEVGRYIAMRLMLRHQGFGQGVSFGIGHGGLEAGIIGLNNLLLLLLYPSLITAEAPMLVAAAGIERIFAMLAHVGFSVMVMYSVQFKKPLWLVISILAHGVMDGLLGILQMAGVGTLGIELYVAAFGLALLCYTLYMRKRWGRKPGAAPTVAEATPTPLVAEPPADEAPADEEKSEQVQEVTQPETTEVDTDAQT